MSHTGHSKPDTSINDLLDIDRFGMSPTIYRTLLMAQHVMDSTAAHVHCPVCYETVSVEIRGDFTKFKPACNCFVQRYKAWDGKI
jgi:hypothetical protein